MDQFEFTLKFKKLDIVNSTIQTAMKMGGIVAIVVLFVSGLKGISGKQTILNIAMQVAIKMSLTSKISYLFGASGIAYGLRQRNLRRSTIERMSVHQRKLETALDANRTSSEITLNGTTRPDDKALE